MFTPNIWIFFLLYTKFIDEENVLHFFCVMFDLQFCPLAVINKKFSISLVKIRVTFGKYALYFSNIFLYFVNLYIIKGLTLVLLNQVLFCLVVYIQIRWLEKKPSDQGLLCLQHRLCISSIVCTGNLIGWQSPVGVYFIHLDKGADWLTMFIFQGLAGCHQLLDEPVNISLHWSDKTFGRFSDDETHLNVDVSRNIPVLCVREISTKDWYENPNCSVKAIILQLLTNFHFNKALYWFTFVVTLFPVWLMSTGIMQACLCLQAPTYIFTLGKTSL